MNPGARVSFIVDKNIAGRMERVIRMCDGRVINKRFDSGATVFEVEKT